MQAFEKFCTLLLSEEDSDHEFESPRQSLLDLWAGLELLGPIPMEAPWAAQTHYCEELAKLAGYRPPGSWAGLIAAATSAGWLRIGYHTLHPTLTAQEVHSLDEESIPRYLVEGFTRFLRPPSAAADLFVLLGIHPLWGLAVANEVGASRGRLLTDAERARTPSRYIPRIRTMIFSAIAAMLSTLRAMGPRKRYDFRLFCEVISDIRLMSRQLGNAGDQPQRGEVPIFVREIDAFQLYERRCILDLVSTVFLPAGLVKLFPDGMMAVHSPALSRIRADHLAAEAQRAWLEAAWNLHEDPLVA